ncbi:MAG: GGDEF domain-containing protein, partial [Eggerthella sp.]|nr:GGDEF domain-containing protein [Eggerthella sp.]
MRRRNVATVIGFAGFALIVVALVGSLGAFVYREMGAMRQRDALNLLNYFQQAMVTKLYDEVSPVDDLAAAFEVDPDDEAWFPRVAGELLEREEVSYVAYVRGDTMAYAYPEEEFGDTVGDDLTSFSYVYTLAKWTDGFVVESSVELSSGENVFLFVRPVNVGGSYYGEAVVGVKESYVLEQLDFASLEEAGYLYELWSVSPQDGSKDVIAASGGSHDFSHAAKSTFNMPTQWTLPIMPEQGWIPRECSILLAVGVIVLEAMIFGLAFAL